MPIAITAASRDDIFKQIFHTFIVQLAETKRLEQGDRPRTHGENIANDAADTGCRALKRLDLRTDGCDFDLEHDRQLVTDIDNPRSFPGPIKTAAL